MVIAVEDTHRGGYAVTLLGGDLRVLYVYAERPPSRGDRRDPVGWKYCTTRNSTEGSHYGVFQKVGR